MLDLDGASAEFTRFDKDLKKRGIKNLTSADDKQRLRTLSEGWQREYRPRLIAALGESDAIGSVDEDVKWLRARCSGRSDVSEVRAVLRRVARTLDRDLLPDYDTARWTSATRHAAVASDDGELFASRLEALNGALALSYRQALIDLDDSDRLTYVGPATELREVLGATIRELSPADDEIESQPWFKGHQGRPTQAERIRAILDDKKKAEQPSKTLEIINDLIGAVARSTYNRASAATHLAREATQPEVIRIRNWVEAVLVEILPSEQRN